jgi:LAS superfamily LD-carboxypeptidase LdcB
MIMGGMLQACEAGDSIQPNVAPRATAVTHQQQAHLNLNPNANYLMGKFNPAKNNLFTEIPNKYADRSGLYLRKETLVAFIKMHTAAKKAGVRLTIRSATRNFNAQKRIWERKWSGKKKLSDGTNVARDIRNPVNKSYKILEYSSMPGTSRHHWGTDIDLNAFNNSWFATGEGLKVFNWLNANAAKYGFCRPYTAGRSYGYHEEKWHWSYKPLSAPMLKEASLVLTDDKIRGFLGSNTAVQIGVVKKYIFGVSEACK